MISQRASAPDRGATLRTGTFISTVGIHAKTERWRYTAPSGSNAFVTGGHLQLRRSAGAGGIGNVRALITLEIDGIERAHLCSCFLTQLHLVSGLFKQKNMSRMSLLILAGQSVKCTTADLSAAGNNVYSIAVVFMEFNA